MACSRMWIRRRWLSLLLHWSWLIVVTQGSGVRPLYGLHSDALMAGEGQLVVPRRVHPDGAFMTHQLDYAHELDHRRHRQRRSLNSEQDAQPAELHVLVPLANETLHLELMAHSYFLAPHLVVERHRRDLRTRSSLTARHLNCHFHGKVRGQPATNVAISTCSGLVGHIRTASNEYYIEPSKEHQAHPVNGHPHVVFQRSSVKPKHSSRKRNKRKRIGQSGGAGAEVSNCGTREPRRRMETRLEWQARGKVKVQGGRQIRRHHHHHQHQHQHQDHHYKHKNHHHQQKNHRVPHTKFKYETQFQTEPEIHPEMPRRRRSISSPRHVETLIVADATMSAFHRDLNGYLLTIMNMVSALYKDPSIGNSIEIVVVRIIQLDEEESQLQLNLTQNAQKNLDRFCSWQHKLNKGSEKDPHHHDVAILITRKNICANNCMTLGLANVGGMCKPKQSCSVNEDNGIMLSHTITHELGHKYYYFETHAAFLPVQPRGHNPCKLFCSDVDDTIIANWGATVLDGTPCTLGTNNMCIDGICKKVGCDWIVDSEVQDDRCGICGGTGDHCQPVRDTYADPFAAKDGAYVEIVTIPARARHILIRELANSPHFLAIATGGGERFYLNGDSLISMPGEFEIAGAESLYDRVDEQETITIPQPIQHSISLYAIVRGNESNAGIFYEFTLPALNVTAGRQFLWRLSNWTACSASCGGGVQHREPSCQENGKALADTLPCWTHAKNKRPARQSRGCGDQPCPAHWWPGPWQFCPVTCLSAVGGGSLAPPQRRRSVVCLDEHDVVVADAECGLLQKPPEMEPCESTLPICRTK
ncbi:uncharacterized protein Dyak_GE16421 [Drosophila yakuba]|uniref:Peptidase M12B domain-containing protein n=1 Tax=Drosophila yakuba TaxID=7245 RepID=B4PZC0_DROYA|nr:uncharacterized protein Dyak_GE16421 [Drosophila yakuba]